MFDAEKEIANLRSVLGVDKTPDAIFRTAGYIVSHVVGLLTAVPFVEAAWATAREAHETAIRIAALKDIIALLERLELGRWRGVPSHDQQAVSLEKNVADRAVEIVRERLCSVDDIKVALRTGIGLTPHEDQDSRPEPLTDDWLEREAKRHVQAEPTRDAWNTALRCAKEQVRCYIDALELTWARSARRG